MIALLWFRQDLRLADHPALAAAVARGAVVPVYISGPEEEGEWAPGAASRWWLHRSLYALDAQLRALGSRLILRRGSALATLVSLCRESGANAVYWNRRYEPTAIARDAQVKEALRASGIEAESFNAALLIEPWNIRTQAGTPFQVFTPYWKKAVQQLGDAPPMPVPAPSSLQPPATWPASAAVEELQLLPRVRWYDSIAAHWTPGEAGAIARLQAFIESALPRYATARDTPAVHGTSRLSPHLHFGEISPRQIWQAIGAAAAERGLAAAQWPRDKFLAEVIWREFAHHLLYHFPRTPGEPLREDWRAFKWRNDEHALRAWQHGRTGIPLVDAGMRELWATGWMHNRVRMITGSFLVKNLRLNWQSGARWFWDTLVDADLANNTLGWQWIAGCGADASPWFRIFNPLTQAGRFDPDGSYVRKWIPELGTDAYPKPIVDLRASREAALGAYRQLRATS